MANNVIQPAKLLIHSSRFYDDFYSWLQFDFIGSSESPKKADL